MVLRDSVHICLLIMALNDLDFQSADIENAYLLAPYRGKIWTRDGPEFRQFLFLFLIVMALYGLKPSGA